MSKNSMTLCCASTAILDFVETFIPSETCVAHAGNGLLNFSTSTKHIRQFAAIDNFL